MSMILGVDTGGTYTDAVLVKGKRIVRKAKSFTTQDCLTEGISRCFDMLGNLKEYDISEVHMSTTLAANHILERNFERIGLLQIDKEIEGKVPAKYTLMLKDPFGENDDVRGFDKIAEMPDIRKVFLGNVDYLVISSPGNDREHRLAKLIKRDIGLAVFCARDYSRIDDYTERTISAMLTIYLVPVIEQWINSTQQMMREKGINADLKIINAMGKLITCQEARQNPLSTLFSGFAASIMGGIAMTKTRDFIIADMGGTSTDITRIINRKFREVKEVTEVGGFKIREGTMDVQTFGTGGDSYIRINQRGIITIGPQKAFPICLMGSKYPNIAEELGRCRRPKNYEMLTVQDVDCFIGSKRYRRGELTGFENEIVEYLMDTPHNVFTIAEYFKKDPDALHLDKLLRKGAINLISVTPTDVLHVEGTYKQWDEGASNVAVRYMAKQLGVTKKVCLTMLKEAIGKQLVKACMQSIANFEKEQFDFNDSKGAKFMLERFFDDSESMLEMSFTINKPIIALGAPAGAWFGQVARKLGTKIVLPDDCDVAGAFGAAIAK